jgi:hypothetical protein
MFIAKMVIITWRPNHSRRERYTVHTTFIFWPMVFSGGRLGESHLHGGVSSGVTDQTKQMPRPPCPCHLSYRVCPCASSATFFTGQKLLFDLQGTDFRRLAAKAAGVVAIYVSHYWDMEVHADLTVCKHIYTPSVHLSGHRKFT